MSIFGNNRIAISTVLLSAGIILSSWMYTPLPTVIARYVWQQYRTATLALILDRSDAELAMSIGNYHFSGVTGSGAYNPDIALRAFAKAVSIEPNMRWGHYQLARIYFVKGNFNKALEEIDKELEANPGNVRSYYIRALIYGYRNSAGDLARAEADFEQFIQFAPKEWGGYNDLAWILSREGKHREVLEVLSLAFANVSRAEENPWLWNALGVAHLSLEEYPKAADAFAKAKTFVLRLTTDEWRRAYPGNDPAQGEAGLLAFRQAIAENLAQATMHSRVNP